MITDREQTLPRLYQGTKFRKYIKSTYNSSLLECNVFSVLKNTTNIDWKLSPRVVCPKQLQALIRGQSISKSGAIRRARLVT